MSEKLWKSARYNHVIHRRMGSRAQIAESTLPAWCTDAPKVGVRER